MIERPVKCAACGDEVQKDEGHIWLNMAVYHLKPCRGIFNLEWPTNVRLWAREFKGRREREESHLGY